MKKKEKLLAKLTEKQKMAREVIKDAIKQINSGVYSPEKGNLVDVYVLRKLACGVKQQMQPLVKRLVNDRIPCAVCARGCLLLSTISKYNDYLFDPGSFGYNYLEPELGGDKCAFYSRDNSTDKKLLEVFSERTIALAERVFEGSFNEDVLSVQDINAALRYRSQLMVFSFTRTNTRLQSSTTYVLKGILSNMLRNNGELVIPKKYYKWRKS